jgi:hypothetical protein
MREKIAKHLSELDDGEWPKPTYLIWADSISRLIRQGIEGRTPQYKRRETYDYFKGFEDCECEILSLLGGRNGDTTREH